MPDRFFEKDIRWRTQASRDGTSAYPGHWYVKGAKIVGEVNADDGYLMSHNLPLGIWPVFIGGHVDTEMEVANLRRRITEMLNADHQARMGRLANA